MQFLVMICNLVLASVYAGLSVYYANSGKAADAGFGAAVAVLNGLMFLAWLVKS